MPVIILDAMTMTSGMMYASNCTTGTHKSWKTVYYSRTPTKYKLMVCLCLDDGAEAFCELCRALMSTGRAAEASELLQRAVFLNKSSSSKGGASVGGKPMYRGRKDELKLLLADVKCSEGDYTGAIDELKYICNR